MNKKAKKWYKLDNVAKIFPPTTNKYDTKTFRFSVSLIEEIDEVVLQRALDKIFGKSQNSEPVKTDPNNPTKNNYDNQDINMLIQQANDIYIKANQASKDGDWSSYGEYLKQLENILKQLNIVVNGPIVTNDVITEPIETNPSDSTVTP